MRPESGIVGILVSDCHYCKNPPIFRSDEPDWFAAQLRPIKELDSLQKKYQCPIFIAGDITNTFRQGPELINFLLEHHPRAWTVPGQHDLPLHNYEDIKKSAYWTLVQAGLLFDLKPAEEKSFDMFTMVGYPWGIRPGPYEGEVGSLAIKIAVIHAYIWKKEHSYPGAPESSRLKRWWKRLEGFDVAVFGDNHKGFIANNPEGCSIMNCGTLMKRNSDEIDYRPHIGLLTDKGSIKPYYLDTSKDVYLDVKVAREAERVLDMCEFVGELENLEGEDVLDYPEIMRTVLRKEHISKKVCKLVLRSMEKRKDD